MVTLVRRSGKLPWMAFALALAICYEAVGDKAEASKEFESVLAKNPQLKIVSNVAVGYNNLDVAAGTRRGVMMTNTPGVLDDTTADFAWALLMAIARRALEADAHMRSGVWPGWDLEDQQTAGL